MKSSLKTYRVAGFCFTIEGLPFEADNLKPFCVPEPDGETIFSLKIVQSLPHCDGELIYRSREEPRSTLISLYSLPSGGYFFEVQEIPGVPIAGRMAVSDDFKSAQLLLSGTDDRYALNSCLMLMFSFSTACKGALEMHSCVVANDGRGYLFLGKSGTGKSTHGALWLRHIPGTKLLNDDNPIMRLLPDGTVRVYGSPWSGKTPCYKAQDVPVGAIVSLKQAPYNKISRLPIVQAYVTLMESSSSFRPIRHLADGWHSTMEGICTAIPVYRLECLPDKAAALLCHSAVSGQSL